MGTVGETSFATPGELELEITRTFDASRQTVFDAFTGVRLGEPVDGPAGLGGHRAARSTPRPGGVYRFVWKSPQGYEVENGGTCDEVSAPERLVTTQDARRRPDPSHRRPDRGAEADTMTYTVEYPSTEMRDAAAQMPMKEAIDAGYDKLAEHLATIA